MKKGLLAALIATIVVLSSLFVLAAKPSKTCTTIQDQVLMTSGGELIPLGFMENGYNYQAHLYNGLYGEDMLVMKWNDAWLSNKDCDFDGKLDRHYGFTSYIGSGAWLTNHWTGSYESTDTWVYTLVQKDPSTWEVIAGASGVMTYKMDSFEFEATGMVAGVEYALMYYPDPWPGTGCQVLGTATADISGNVVISEDFNFSAIPIIGDLNLPDFKIWLVPTSDINCPSGMVSWNPTAYLFDLTLEPEPYMCYWNDFIKIVAVPADAYPDAGYWYTADGVLIGESIWGEFAIIQEVWNDPCAGYNGLYVRGDAPSGFGFYKP